MVHSNALLWKKGPVHTVWKASFCKESELSRDKVAGTDIVASVGEIMLDVRSPHGLHLAVLAKLLFGIVRIFSKKMEFLLHDFNELSRSFRLSQLAEPTLPSGRLTLGVLKQANKDVRVGRLVVGQQNTCKVQKTVHAVRTTEVSSAISSEGHSVRVETEVTLGISVVIKETRLPDGLPTFTIPRSFELDSFNLGIAEDIDDEGDDHHQLAHQDILLRDERHHAPYFYEPYQRVSCSYAVDSAGFLPEYIALPNNILDFTEGGKSEIENKNADSAWFTPLKDVLPPEMMGMVAEAKDLAKESKTGDNSVRQVNMNENNRGSDCTMISIPLQESQELQCSDNALENMACGSRSANYTTTEASENDSLENTAPPAAVFPVLGSDTGEESLKPLVRKCKIRPDNELSPSTPEPLQEDTPGPSSSRFRVRTPAKTEKSQSTRKRRRALLYRKQDYIWTERESQQRVRRKLTWSLFDDEGTVLLNEMLRGAIEDASDLVQQRRKAPHTHLDIWRVAKLGSLSYTFMDPLIPYQTSIPLARVTAPEAPKSSYEESVKARRRLSYEQSESIHVCKDTGSTERENTLDTSRKRKLKEPIDSEVRVDCQTESWPVQDEVCTCNEDTIKEKSAQVKADEPSSKVPLKNGLHESENQILLHTEVLNAAVDNIDENIIVDEGHSTDEGLQNSTRTRKIASILHQLFLDQKRKEGTTTLSLSQVLEGTKRKIAALFFYETLVLKNRGLVEVKQEHHYDDIILSETPKLKAELQRCRN
ncbi:sister chromatid cohesion 1 protein 2 [Zea mays]|nr:sister chromatid cohesion 1 protein 2 [Zea mays]AQK44413.1 Sister chromatid cohesion 1 protein 2 [Zea mays]|eukprot:XP_020401648.1 sister chromatid cohesion 1 protein 2 [Zea mays]